MTQQPSGSVVCRLQRLLAGNCLTEGQTRLATALATRLERPTRVTVAGFEKSGKSALVDMILGEPSVSEVSAPTVHMVYGPTRRASLRDELGRVRHVDILSGDTENTGTTYTLELPLPQLKTMQLAVLTLHDDDKCASALLDRQADATDIIVWCSRSVEEREVMLWSRLPTRLKDHSFLVVSTEDTSGERGICADVRKNVKLAAAAGLANQFPVAARQAVLAQRQGQILDRGRWHSSGAAAFMSALISEVETNRAADGDYAEILLAKFERPQDRGAVAVELAERSKCRPTSPVPDALSAGSPEIRRDTIDTALSILTTPFDEAIRGNTAAEPVVEEILQQAAQAAGALSALFADKSLQFPEVADLRVMTQDCEDLLALLQNANSDASARDAVTALLQVKKELSEAVAA